MYHFYMDEGICEFTKNVMIFEKEFGIKYGGFFPNDRTVLKLSDVIGKDKEIKYVAKGSNGHAYRIVTANKNKYILKVVPYCLQNNDINDVCRHENVELQIASTLCEKFIINQKTKHLCVPYCGFLIKKNDYLNFSANNKHLKDVQYNSYHDTFLCFISEWADLGDLSLYIRKQSGIMSEMVWKTILFQVFSTLCLIYEIYPNFKHNDLKTDNILVFADKSKKEYHQYIIGGKVYHIPNIGIQLKIWDFDFASIQGIVNNKKFDEAWTQNYNIHGYKNQYYDIFFLLNNIIKYDIKNFYINPDVPQQIKNMFKHILIDCSSNDIKECRLLKNIEYVTPAYIFGETDDFNMFTKAGFQDEVYDIKKNHPEVDMFLKSIGVFQPFYTVLNDKIII